ncbi:uncharacterized protein LOC118199193 isoform X2 [Stegodyphus dumicola]|uniref:uncharacterized protein LOC118199193 isoform X2 n=1 Tax=Stegodyphus dumicola TaxID=202533 RepID=UPI0015ABBF83|nr:uncharacterized protein LOC118199193 isoform X2 [Stegodyphus dumicola]
MLSLSVIAVLVSVASTLPTSRQDRGFDPFAGGFAYAGFPFGTYAGAGVPMFFNPFDFTRPYMPWFPFVMPSMEWYKGPNVCEEKKISQEPDDIKEWINDDSFGVADYQHQSKSCKGTNTKYVCFGREVTNEGSQMVATKYECCHGFVRPSDGRPGCVESGVENVPLQ